MKKEKKNPVTRVIYTLFHRFIHSSVRTYIRRYIIVLKFPSIRIMLLGNVRRDMYSDYRTNLDASHLISSLSTPLSSSSTTARTPITPQQTTMNYAHMQYRYTTVC
jgi:hypothetical protein